MTNSPHDTHAIPANDGPAIPKPSPRELLDHAAALTRLGDAYAIPDKTHDLSIRREFGNVVVTAEAKGDDRVAYLQDGVALDLGRVLASLTPTQRQLLVDDLTGGEK